MSNFVVQIYKQAKSNQAPAIHLPDNLPQHELVAPALIEVAQGLFEDNGVLVVQNLFSNKFIARLYQAFVACYQSYFADQDYADALKVGDKRRMLTLNFQTPFNDPNLWGNPFLLYLMRGLLGSEFVLGSLGAVISLPGAEHQHIHRDHPALFEEEGLDLNLPSFAITVVVPLIDLTPETGSTRVWKGSHRLPHCQDSNLETSHVPFVPTGSCYLMDYQLLHGGTPNVSNQVRPILYLTYYRSWFQEAVNYEKQSRIAITQPEYDRIPEKYKFLFERVRESFRLVASPNQLLHDAPIERSFEQLTTTEQAKKLENLAQKTLGNYQLDGAEIELISHGENTVFSVAVPGSFSEKIDPNPSPSNRSILRVHRANYLSVEAIESELHWLRSLRQDAQLPVPEPIPTADGKLCTAVSHPEVPEVRVCSLTRWLDGQFLSGEDRSGRLKQLEIEAVGRLLGQLHRYAAQWSPPENFTRPRWDWNGLFGTGAGYSNNGARVWELTPPPYRQRFEAVSEQVKAVMDDLGEGSDQFGLIHGDFWLGNLLGEAGEVRPIDFADCGFGYWGYDVARFLNDFWYSPNFSLCLDTLLAGYRQIRAFPEEQLPYLNLFIAAQQVSFALWRINRAQEHPGFRATLAEDLQEAVEAVEVLLADQ